MKKRILASLLSLCLMLGLLPTAALATGTTPETATTLSDDTSVDSTEAVTRAQMAEMVYEHESLKSDIDTMAGGGTEPSFTDISECTDDQKAAITALYKANIISGNTATTFNPSGTVTRGEFAVVLWRATGSRSNKTAMTGAFTDTLESWYAPAVNCFYGAGLVSGTANGEFNGEDTISVMGVNTFLTAYATNKENFINNTVSGSTTRAEMTVEFYEKFQPELSKLAVTRTGDMPFTDLSGCTEEQVKAIQFFYEREIISGTSETTFHPHTPVSNFQIAALLQRCATKELLAETPATFSLFNAASLAEQTPVEWLKGQGLDVSAAENNPNAPALTTTLTTWRDGLAPGVPTFSPAGDSTFENSQTVTISAAAGDENAATYSIYYTTDGSKPTTNSSTQYSEALTITDTTTVKAIAVKNNLVSEIATATYTKQTQEPEQPALTITATPTSLTGGGTVTLMVSNIPTSQAVSVVCDNPSYTPAQSTDGTWTVTLPNATATYTFTATAGTEAASCTVSVTYQGSGNTGSGSSSSNSGASGVSGSGDDVSISVSGGSVSTSQLTQAVRKADSSSAIAIDASSRSSVSLSSDGLQAAADNSNDVTIELKNGEVTLSPEALSAVVEQAGTTITLTVDPVDADELNSRQQAAVGDAPVFDLTFKSGGKTIADFDGGLVTVAIPYELPDDQDPAGVVVWFMDDNGNITPCETMYDLRTETVIFTTRHFSKYVIGYEKPMNFVDVSSGSWYEEAVQYVYEKGLMAGTSDTTFEPDTTTSRGMIVTILYRLEGAPAVSGSSGFADVADGQYYADAVAWAASNDIVAGYGDNLFGPNDPITREQMAVILYRYAQYKGYDVTASADLSDYDDVAQVSSYALAALQWANAEGLVNGTSLTTLSPEGQATRAQVAVMLMRFLDAI